MRKKIEEALDRYIDKHRPKIKTHVDNHLERLKNLIVEHLPHHVMEHIKKHSEGGDGFFETIYQVVGTMSEQMTGDMKDEMYAMTRENLDDITVNSSEDLTTVVVRESKNAVSEVTRKKEKNDDDDAWWKEIDLSFLKGGKEGILNKFAEFVRPHVRSCGEDINEKISTKLPEHAKHKLREKLGFGSKNREVSEATVVKDRGIHFHKEGFKNLMEKFHHGEGEDIVSKTFDRIFHRLPEKLREMMEPYIKEFEENLLKTLHIELRENVFKEDNFLGSIKSMISVDKDGDGKNDFIQGVSHAMDSIFHHHHKK